MKMPDQIRSSLRSMLRPLHWTVGIRDRGDGKWYVTVQNTGLDAHKTTAAINRAFDHAGWPIPTLTSGGPSGCTYRFEGPKAKQPELPLVTKPVEPSPPNVLATALSVEMAFPQFHFRTDEKIAELPNKWFFNTRVSHLPANVNASTMPTARRLTLTDGAIDEIVDYARRALSQANSDYSVTAVEVMGRGLDRRFTLHYFKPKKTESKPDVSITEASDPLTLPRVDVKGQPDTLDIAKLVSQAFPRFNFTTDKTIFTSKTGDGERYFNARVDPKPPHTDTVTDTDIYNIVDLARKLLSKAGSEFTVEPVEVDQRGSKNRGFTLHYSTTVPELTATSHEAWFDRIAKALSDQWTTLDVTTDPSHPFQLHIREVTGFRSPNMGVLTVPLTTMIVDEVKRLVHQHLNGFEVQVAGFASGPSGGGKTYVKSTEVGELVLQIDRVAHQVHAEEKYSPLGNLKLTSFPTKRDLVVGHYVTYHDGSILLNTKPFAGSEPVVPLAELEQLREEFEVFKRARQIEYQKLVARFDLLHSGVMEIYNKGTQWTAELNDLLIKSNS